MWQTLTIKNGNIHTVLKSKREGQIEKVYLIGKDTSYQIDHIRQRYVIMPKVPVAAEVKVAETSGTKRSWDISASNTSAKKPWADNLLFG
jgi:hypothetical protein